MMDYRSWGYRPPNRQNAVRPHWRDFELDSFAGSLLPYGNGRSYGDSCLNSSGLVVDSRALNKFMSFDTEKGVLRCEAGVLFPDILATIVPHGWFLPVTPGTKFVTVGGAIANDVHGKNHHRDGTFGRHVRCFELLRSNGDRIVCSETSNPELYAATIGGLGLTGFMTWAEIQLIPITSPGIDVETVAFSDLAEFYELSKQSHADYRYTVAWLDCISSGRNFGRGLFIRGNHSTVSDALDSAPRKQQLPVPFNLPKWFINKFSIRAFNTLYYNYHRRFSSGASVSHYDPFFYPLDNISNWNRIYGKDGFFQYQFIIPRSATDVMEQILSKIVSSGLGSFLAVLKEFGDIPSPGMMSFPKPGICIALDFANRGDLTMKVLDELDELVLGANGITYPAKDNRMSGQAFRSYYPEYNRFAEFIDPRFTSDFWRRVNDNSA